MALTREGRIGWGGGNQLVRTRADYARAGFLTLVPDIAPDLVPLRQRLMALVKRPVNIQASRDLVMYVRGELGGQPYLVLLDKSEDS